VQVEQQDAQAQRHLAGLRRQPRQERHGLQLLVVALVEVVLAGEEGVPAAVPSQMDHRYLLAQRGDHVGL
jgi:hypothetical protein